MSSELVLKAGSRKSELALIQTNSVCDSLKLLEPQCKLDIISMTTKGDNDLDKPLPKVGKNVFTKELEDKLIDESVDCVVHSMKDVSTSLPSGLVIGAVLEREDPRDAVICSIKHNDKKLSQLPKNSVVGTSSLRRAAQIRQSYPHLLVRDIRGNLNTRLQKLDAEQSEYSAIILALAGIRRMGWEDRVTEILDPDDMLYAVGQGALAVQCREDDFKMLPLLQRISHRETTLRIIAERSFMQTLGGGCTAPLAVNSSIENSVLSLTGGVWQLDGSEAMIDTMTTSLEESEIDEPPRKLAHMDSKQYTGIIAPHIPTDQLDAAAGLGTDLAMKLKERGAGEVIVNAKKELAGLSAPGASDASNGKSSSIS